VFGPGIGVTPENFKNYNISHVVNCGFDVDSPQWFRDQNPEKYAVVYAVDSEDSDITGWYPVFQTYMNKFLADKKCTGVYVHCQAGINRSAFLCLLYMCMKFKYSMDVCIRAILLQRPCALQNAKFREQVTEYIKKHQ
jgi:protein-tyrosine phosphatase